MKAKTPSVSFDRNAVRISFNPYTGSSKLVAFAIVVLLIFFPILAFSQDAVQQNEKRDKAFWFDLGIGWGGQGNAFNTGFSYEIRPARFLSARFSSVITNDYCDEVALFIPVAEPLGKSALSFELAYGFLRKGRSNIANFSAGLAYVSVETAGGDEEPPGGSIFYYSACPADYAVTNEGTLGLTLQAQFIPCLRWGGIGVTPYLNINPKYVFASLTIGVAFGHFRARVP